MFVPFTGSDFVGVPVRERAYVGNEVFGEILCFGEGVHEGGAHFVGVTGCAEEAYEAVDEGDIRGYREDALGDGFAETGECRRGGGGGKRPGLILQVIQVVERHSLY